MKLASFENELALEIFINYLGPVGDFKAGYKRP